MGYKIVLSFDDAYEAFQALEYLGDEDAPVLLDEESSYFENSSGVRYTLWRSFDHVSASLQEVQNGTKVGGF